MEIRQPFIATGIGSLPYTDCATAIDVIKKTFPEMPHWPQLPKLTTSEGLINQYISPLSKLGLVIAEPGRSAYFDTNQSDWLDKVTEFYNIYLHLLDGDESYLDFFAFPQETATGFYAFLQELENGGFPQAKYIKGQITGPVTLGIQLTNQDRRSSYYDDQLRDIVVKSIALQALWQAKNLGKYNVPVVIFIDEPGLYAYGQSTHITLNKEQITEELNIIIDAIHSAGAFAGVHVCASTDWAMILNSNTDILNFDAFEYFLSLLPFVAEVKCFLERKGVLAWGLVPTSDKVTDLDENRLIQLFEEVIEVLGAKGLDREELLKQAIITPSCGTGTLNEDISGMIYKLTRGLFEQLRSKNTE